MIKKIITISILLLLLTACANTVMLPKSPKEAISIKETAISELLDRMESGKGGISGKIIRPEFWQDNLLYAYAAPYLGDPKGEGIYILDDKLNESTEITKNDSFYIINIPPGIYVLVIGPDTDTAKAYREDGVAIKITVLEGQIIDIGEVKLDY